MRRHRRRHRAHGRLGATTVELRPLRPADLGEVCAVVNRAAVHDGAQFVMAVEEIEESLAVPYVDLDRDARVAVVDGAIAGWTWVSNQPADRALERAFLHGEVDPAHRRLGVGRALLGWSVERATERLRSRTHSLPRVVRVDAYDWMEANHRLYARFGFRPVRWFEELIRPLADVPPAAAPEGIEIVPWPDDRDGELLAVRNAAFADHWGSSPVDTDTWRTIVRGHGARPDLSVVAVDRSGEVVALCLNHAYPEDEAVTGRREAWVHNLATLAPHRGRGIASALIARSLAAFTAAGLTHAMIGVDADSITGAARLYRSLGFEPLRRSITHELEVS